MGTTGTTRGEQNIARISEVLTLLATARRATRYLNAAHSGGDANLAVYRASKMLAAAIEAATEVALQTESFVADRYLEEA